MPLYSYEGTGAGLITMVDKGEKDKLKVKRQRENLKC